MSRMALDTSVPPSVLQRAQADLDRELGAVLAQPEQLEPDAHRARARLTEVAGAVPGMSPAKALRDEQLDPLADQLVSCVAEEPLRLGVDQDDAAVPVDDDHRVGRGLEQVPESFFRLLALADVADRGGDQRLALGLERAQADFDRKLGPVLAQAGELEAGPHGPTRGSAKKFARCPGCASRMRSGIRISTGLPSSSPSCSRTASRSAR